MDIQSFQIQCNRKYCLRRMSTSDKCLKEDKQIQCYNKFSHSISTQFEKNKKKIEENYKHFHDNFAEIVSTQFEKNKKKIEETYIRKGKELLDYLDKKEKGELVYDVDERWIIVKNFIQARDHTCRFYSIMTEDEKRIVNPYLWGDMKLLDGAHCISRSRSFKMVYDFDNVYSIFRYLHSCLDNSINPFTQEQCSKEEIEQYWIRIIGKEKYFELQERCGNKK